MLAAIVGGAFLDLLDAVLRPMMEAFAVTTTANTTTASPNIDTIGSTVGIQVGSVVTGAGIPASPPTTVVSIATAAGTAVLSANATASASGVSLTFTPPGLAKNPQMGLYTNNITATRTTILTDFTEPAYPGYARQDMSVSPPVIDGQGNDIQDYGCIHWQPTGTWVSPVPILGYFVSFEVSGVAKYFYSEPFAGPVNLVTATDAYDVGFKGYIPNSKVYGGQSC